jgi:hypothetical protein
MADGPEPRYITEQAPKRRSLRLSRLTAVVRDAKTDETLRVRSMKLAGQVAELLNAAARRRLPRRVPTDSPFRRYETVRDAHGDTRLLRTSRGVDSQIIGVSSSRALAEQAAELLNRVDPEQLGAPEPGRIIDPFA